MYVGNGMRLAVEAIVSFDLILPNELVIILDNFHYALSITRGVVSFSRLIDNGYMHTFVDYGIYVMNDDVFYFNAIPHDGIDEIDMHNLYPNNSLTLIEASGSHTFHEASGSNVGLELLKELDTQPSNETSEQHDEVKHNEVEPHVEEHKLGDLNEPRDYKAALSYPEYDKWVDAMNVKMQSMKDNQDLGEAAYIIGIKIIRDGSKRLISLSQSASFDKILKKFKLEISKRGKRGNVPMQEKPNLSKAQDMVLVYGGNPENELKVTSYTNGSFQTDKDDTKSQSRYVFVLNGGAVEWKSAKQSTIAISSIESEYIVVAKPSMKVVWMRKFIDELGNVMPTNKRPIKISLDAGKFNETAPRKLYCIFLMNGFHVVVLLAVASAVHVTQGLLIRHEKSSTKGLDYLYQKYCWNILVGSTSYTLEIHKLPFLEQPIPTMPVPPAGQVTRSDVLATHSTWVNAQKEIA
nr:hypothetical protein [Tanacetum cinerariifolium]